MFKIYDNIKLKNVRKLIGIFYLMRGNGYILRRKEELLVNLYVVPFANILIRKY